MVWGSRMRSGDAREFLSSYGELLMVTGSWTEYALLRQILREDDPAV